MGLYPTVNRTKFLAIPTISQMDWPEQAAVTILPEPATWALFDPKGADKSWLLVGSGQSRSFTPLFISGCWTVIGYDASGIEIARATIQVGDAQGWMTAPDWDDPSWLIRNVNGIVSATPGGKVLTLADKSFPLPFDADVFYQPVEIPAGCTNVEVETQLPTTGDDHTAVVWSGFAVDASGIAGQSNAGGIEQTDAANQRATYFRNNAVFYQGTASPIPKWCRSSWPMDNFLRTAAIVHQYTDDTGLYFNVNAYNMGGMALTPTRHFGLWVNRATADGNAYNIAVTLRLKVT